MYRLFFYNQFLFAFDILFLLFLSSLHQAENRPVK